MARTPNPLAGARKCASQAATKWKKAIRTAKWAHWEQHLQASDKNMTWKTINALGAPSHSRKIGDMEGEETFQGKCNKFRLALFPANGRLPPPSPKTLYKNRSQTSLTPSQTVPPTNSA